MMEESEFAFRAILLKKYGERIDGEDQLISNV